MKESAHPVAPPAGAVVLFDGRSLDGWRSRKTGGAAGWKIVDGAAEVVAGTGDIVSVHELGDAKVHVEFWLPRMSDRNGQARANSGVYLHGRYEIQVLDSWETETEPDRACGALYKAIAPKPGGVRPPETWQTYDIEFRAPRVDANGVVTTAGRITLVHNGVPVIVDGRFEKPTGGELGPDVVERGPLMLQDHGDPVRFRNVWVLPL